MSASLDTPNVTAYQYQLAVQEKFKEICGPLLTLGIKSFDYFKVFKMGTYLVLTDNVEYYKTYFSIIKDCGVFLTEQINNVEKNKSHYFLLNDIKLFDKRRDPIMYLLYDFDRWNSFVIYKLDRQDFIECYIFQMTREDTAFSQFYLNNFALLEHFTVYFNEKAYTLINDFNQNKCACFEQHFNFYHPSKENFLYQRIEQFLQKTYIEKKILITAEKNIFLSTREFECLNYLSLGKSMKEIAKILDLSPRSVEFYLRTLKQKSGLNRGELITKFVQNNLYYSELKRTERKNLCKN